MFITCLLIEFYKHTAKKFNKTENAIRTV